MSNIESPEKIICAAIHFDDKQRHDFQPFNIETGFVICGIRHCDCRTILLLINQNAFMTRDMQGFVTSKNRYVNRKEAYSIALEQNQIINEFNNLKELYSEMLY